ncbi:Molybdenum cofactor sulfurase 1 [Ananas comosus]|uniref:Molybdenum cofactor sulfurase 1 n=2 Tax=Ananas comosus TaxID=4615 RepID=A0A199UJW6_ANACO|nr:Molybdenum cofactor sulfurase 1 [Ananas comosus]CAD1821538.1 unnamed protein product [Ananas comosus var. bracteatus]
MLFFISKHLKGASKHGGKNNHREKQEPKKKRSNKTSNMILVNMRNSPRACLPGCCCPAPLLGLIGPCRRGSTAAAVVTAAATSITSARISRSNFAKSTTSSILASTLFTNHESLPPFADALMNFLAAFPQFEEAQQAEHIRKNEYHHLAHHVCLDYTGISLFSHAQMVNFCSLPSSSSGLSHPPPPLFSISFKYGSWESLLQHVSQEKDLESQIRRRIMGLLNITEADYFMVCTSNRTTAFKLLADSYPFHNNRKLLTVYDYESEAVTTMVESAQKRGARVASAAFTWPSLRIHSAQLRKDLMKKGRKKKHRGLFVFPLQSRMTGTRYPYLWMSLAKENGWHIALDACALGPKDLDTFGLSLIRPDFIICNFYKAFGENPSGFAALFIKKTSCQILEASEITSSIGIVRIVPARSVSQLRDDYSSAELEPQLNKFEEDDAENTSSFSGPISSKEDRPSDNPLSSKEGNKRESSSEIVEEDGVNSAKIERGKEIIAGEDDDIVEEIECRGLDHADSLGLILISNRLRCITNWLLVALSKLRHPHAENGHSLVKIYGPRVKFDRGPALAFNLFDWKGEKVEPSLVQKLADRSDISLSCGFLENIWFSEKYEVDKDSVLEKRVSDKTAAGDHKKKESVPVGINVVNASLGFLTNFEDAYRLWAFIAKFLDADFVEKEKWRYMALNQKMIEV